MESDQPSSTRRKIRFAPKPQTRRLTRTAAAQPKAEEADVDAEARQLLRRFNERDALRGHGQRPKDENKASVQPAFIHGLKQLSTTGAPNVPRDGSHKRSSEQKMKHLDGDTGQLVVSSSSTGDPSEIKKRSADDSVSKAKDYRELWDYAHSYYPTTLPWRMPYSGNPDILDEAEFGEAVKKLEYDENKTNPASELGLLDSNEASGSRLLFLQLPPSLPVIKRSATAKEKEIQGSSAPSNQKVAMEPIGKGSSSRTGTSHRTCSLEDLPAGQMGKLLVYKSGNVKLKLGETLYDVSPGSDCSFAQEVVAINTKEKQCCAIGELYKRAVVTPDVEYLLNRVIDLS